VLFQVEGACVFNSHGTNDGLAVFQHGTEIALNRYRQIFKFMCIVARRCRRQPRALESEHEPFRRVGPLRRAECGKSDRDGGDGAQGEPEP